MSAGTIQGLKVQGTGIFGTQATSFTPPPTTHAAVARSASVVAAAEAKPAPVRGARQKPNRYGGKCQRCNLWVEPEAGVLVGRPGAWGAAHLDGGCPEVTPTLPGVEAPVVERPAKPKRKRPNQYPGKCGLCGRKVHEMEGVLDKDDEDHWVVFHDGPCPTAFPFPEGRYATEDEDGEVHFYHCAEDGEVYAMASDNEHRLARPVAEAVIAQIALDAQGCSKRYGIEFEVCGICGRGLTSEWRKVGIGPVCNEKAAW